MRDVTIDPFFRNHAQVPFAHRLGPFFNPLGEFYTHPPPFLPHAPSGCAKLFISILTANRHTRGVAAIVFCQNISNSLSVK